MGVEPKETQQQREAGHPQPISKGHPLRILEQEAKFARFALADGWKTHGSIRANPLSAHPATGDPGTPCILVTRLPPNEILAQEADLALLWGTRGRGDRVLSHAAAQPQLSCPAGGCAAGRWGARNGKRGLAAGVCRLSSKELGVAARLDPNHDLAPKPLTGLAECLRSPRPGEGNKGEPSHLGGCLAVHAMALFMCDTAGCGGTFDACDELSYSRCIQLPPDSCFRRTIVPYCDCRSTHARPSVTTRERAGGTWGQLRRRREAGHASTEHVQTPPP